MSKFLSVVIPHLLQIRYMENNLKKEALFLYGVSKDLSSKALPNITLSACLLSLSVLTAVSDSVCLTVAQRTESTSHKTTTEGS